MTEKYLETFMDTNCKNECLEISRMLSHADLHTMELSRTSYFRHLVMVRYYRNSSVL